MTPVHSRALRVALPALLALGLVGPAAAEPIRLGLNREDAAPMLTAFALDSSCASTGLPTAAPSVTPRLGQVESRAVVASVPEGPCAGQEAEGVTFVFQASSVLGEENFTLTVENATVGGGAHDIEVNVRP